MIYGKDSAYIGNGLEKDIEELSSVLSEKFDVVQLGDGEEGFSEHLTDLSGFFKEAKQAYDNRNGVAMVMVSDGIYNRGINPAFAAQRLGMPVYTIPLGDTVVQKDVYIYSAKANSITFLGNTFPIEVVVNATRAQGNSVELSLWKGDKKLQTRTIDVTNSRFSVQHTFLIEADAKGAQQYTMRVSGLSGEPNTTNNSKIVYTEVLDARQRILILAHAPHPDIAALRSVIEANDQYEMTLEIGTYSPVKPNDYDLVITHQLPVTSSDFNLLRELREAKLPVFSILGTSTNIPLFNRLGLGLQINGHRKNYNQTFGSMNADFGLFEPGDDLASFVGQAPPLTTPFGEYSKPDNRDVLMYQKIGSVNTEMPLWFFNKQSGYRSGVCLGEGIWRWKFYDYETNGDISNLSEIIQRSMQYLALKDDKRKFKVYTSSRSFFENEKIDFLAEVYNDSYEFTPEADVHVDLKHEDGSTYEYTLVPQQNSYKYSVAALPPGNYSFTASSQIGGTKETVAGSFVVKALQLERLNLTANYGLMRQIAEESGGKTFGREDWTKLARELEDLPAAVSETRTNYRFRDLVSQKWIFFLLFGLLAMEWFGRRWFGGY